MTGLLSQSGLELFNNEEFDFSTSVETSKEILEEESEKNPKSSLNFNSDLWGMWVNGGEYKRNICFDKIKELSPFYKKTSKSSFLIIVKCWVASLIQQSSSNHIQSLYRNLVEFIEISKGFNYDVLEDVETLLLNKYKTRKAYDISLSALNFIEFYRNIDEDFKYTSLLIKVREAKNFDSEHRSLPPTKEVQVFHTIFKHYFKHIDKESEDYLFYFPVYMWWELTMIIPLRPCELVKIKKDCLNFKDGDYYIRLPREKQNKNRIQIVDLIMIPIKLANEIIHYQNKLKDYHKCETLFHPNIIRFIKKRDRFSTVRLGYVLSRFYKEVIGNLYGFSMKTDRIGIPIEDKDGIYDITKPILLGDTRHFSMLNLMRQGYHPLEIARLAGHTSLTVQSNYYGHLEYWVDSTILELMEKITAEIQANKSSILDEDFKNNFVFRSSGEVKIPLDLGYCTDKFQNCAVDSHFYCEFYRITEEEYRTRQEEIKLALDESNNKIKSLLVVLANLQRLSISMSGEEYEYSEHDYLYNKDLIEIKKQLDVALHQYEKVNYHYEKSKKVMMNRGIE